MNNKSRSSLVVTGTDTGVGKSIITAGLVRELHLKEIRAAGLKPVETGCAYAEDHNLIASDGALLNASAPWVPANTVAPYRFAPPIAPAIAARKAGIQLQLQDLVDVIEQARHYADFLVIEGAGGALSPLTESNNTLDLAAKLAAPVLVCAKDTLGTQSQTLAVLEAARQRNLDVLGVVLTRFEEDELVGMQDNAATIHEWGKVEVFQYIPAFEGDAAAQVQATGPHLTQIGLTQRVVDLSASN